MAWLSCVWELLCGCPARGSNGLLFYLYYLYKASANFEYFCLRGDVCPCLRVYPCGPFCILTFIGYFSLLLCMIIQLPRESLFRTTMFISFRSFCTARLLRKVFVRNRISSGFPMPALPLLSGTVILFRSFMVLMFAQDSNQTIILFWSSMELNSCFLNPCWSESSFAHCWNTGTYRALF